MTGRGGEIRTPDPHNPIVVRYQAALRPDRILESRAEARSYKRGNVTCQGGITKAVLYRRSILRTCSSSMRNCLIIC